MRLDKVSPNLYRGSRPECWWHVQYLREIGVTHVVNLQRSGDGEISRWCTYFGLKFLDFDWSGIFTPPAKEVYEILYLLDGQAVPRPTFFVHCRHGRERTGFLVAAYRLHVQLWDYDRAYIEWMALGARFPQFWLWERELRRFAAVRVK